MSKPLILVTNDDGINAPQISVLADALGDIGDVWVYAPDRQRSAVGHAVSLRMPLRVSQFKEQWFMVDGTPADCVLLAVRDLLGAKPDLVVSGINPGANLGSDVIYSGTVAGAHEGMMLGISSFSVSDVSYEPKHTESAAKFAASLADNVIEHGLPHHTMLNVNVPDLPYDKIEGVVITRMGNTSYEGDIVKRTDPRGGTYYWIGGGLPEHEQEPGTDFDAISQNKISITPIQRDITNHEAIQTLMEREIST